MRSAVWKYFKKLGMRPGNRGRADVMVVECGFCGMKMAYNQSTSSLLRHIQKKHNTDARKMEAANSENVIAVFEEQVVEGDVTNVPTTDVDPWGGELVAQTEGQTSVYQIQLVPQSFESPRTKKQKILDIATSEIYSPVSIIDQNQLAVRRRIAAIDTYSVKNRIDEKLIAMLAIDMQPFDIVEDVGFCELLKTIEPKYNLPSRKSLMTMMNTEVVNSRIRCKEELQFVKDVALTSDSWTSNNNESFLSVTCHYFDEKFVLQTRLLDVCMVTESNDTNNLAKLVRTILNEWNLDNKVVCIATNGAENVDAAVQMHGLRPVLCMAHTINSLIKNAIESIVELTNIIVKMRTVVNHLKHCSSANAKFEEVMANSNLSGKKLIMDVKTQWISTFLMMERLIELRDPVSAVVNETEDLPTIFPSNWRVVERCIKVLQPFVQISKELSTDKSVTISKIIPILRNLLRLTTQNADTLREGNVSELGDLNDAAHALAVAIGGELKRITKEYEKSRLLGIATLLDPRFKNLAFGGNSSLLGASIDNLKSEAEKLAKHLSDEHVSSKLSGTAVASSPNGCLSVDSDANSQLHGDELWADFDKEVEKHCADLPNTVAAQEVVTYLNLPNIKRSSSVGEFWFKYQTQFPILSAMARKYLCGQATCVPSERIFMKSGAKFSNRRARLSEENVKMCLLLNK